MTDEAQKLLDELREEALRMDSWFKDEEKRKNYRELKERQLSVLANVIEALKEKQQSLFEKTVKFPHSKDLEQIILGAILVDSQALDKVRFLTEDHFYFDTHKLIFKTIYDISGPIDILTVSEKLKYRAGGPAYLVEMTQRVASAANLEYHARLLIQKYVQRELIRLALETINTINADTEDVFDTVRNIIQGVKIFNVGKQKTAQQ